MGLVMVVDDRSLQVWEPWAVPHVFRMLRLAFIISYMVEAG
jgi:hypothetical protein